MKVLIIGGSITEGVGASKYSNSYVHKLEAYFNQKEDTLVKSIGAGGTASHFGLFRLKRDLGNLNPDIIFIDFAVNDRIYNSEEASIYFEGLVREAMKITDKIVIIDFPTGMSDSCTSIHKKIGYYYNIPIIDAQDKVWQRIGKGEFSWKDISIDNLHPNDKGHHIYYEIIKESLEKTDLNLIKVDRKKESLMNYNFTSPKIMSYEQMIFYGHWKEEAFNLKNKFNKAAATDNVGDAVIFKFKGKCLSMMNLLTKDSGILECQLDNYVFEIDLYNNSEGYFNTTINLLSLEDKEHELIMKVSDRKNKNSLGNKIIIGGFLVDEG